MCVLECQVRPSSLLQSFIENWSCKHFDGLSHSVSAYSGKKVSFTILANVCALSTDKVPQKGLTHVKPGILFPGHRQIV